MTLSAQFLTAAMMHETVFAAGNELFVPASDGGAAAVMGVVAFILFSAVLFFLWRRVFRAHAHHEGVPDAAHAYHPSFHVVAATIASTAGLFLLSVRTVGGIAPFADTGTAAAFFAVLGVVGIAAEWYSPRAKHAVFAFAVGTLVTFILIGFYDMLFQAAKPQNPFFMALGMVCVVLAWKFLFGPWKPQVKAGVLATFAFWVAFHMLAGDPPEERTARLLAAGIAFVPAVIWCMLFLKDHMQRLSMVVLMFLSGMLSTAPILFYDALVRHRAELQFFLFRIVPENFSSTSNAFVTGNLVGISGVRTTLAVTLISFLIVGFIEEVSKFWVMRKSGKQFFSSIDDVLQLSIIVAIGFAFAENILNPTYFMAFVRQYLIYPATPDWGSFMGNVLGRAILTNMVHILSTGVIGYFYGIALFADSYLEDGHKQGRLHFFPEAAQYVLRLPEKEVFRRECIGIGLLSAVVLHGLFNFLVTLPDLLPGRPQTLGDVFGTVEGGVLDHIALLIIPSLFYVVGGFWLLSVLFYKKESMKERGCLVERDTLVKAREIWA